MRVIQRLIERFRKTEQTPQDRAPTSVKTPAHNVVTFPSTDQPSRDSLQHHSASLAPRENTEDYVAVKFEDWMKKDLIVLERSWFVFKNDATNADAKQKLYTASHNICGMARTYGHPAVANICSALCRLVSQDTSHDLLLIEQHVIACRSAHGMIKPRR